MIDSQPKAAAGRFAPSPTGPLHLGSLIAALGSFLVARTTDRRWLLRIDDLDGPRVVPGAADGIMQLLERLGLKWDGTPVWQGQRTARYVEVLDLLKERKEVYPCSCSRREILASAPHAGEEGPIYPGTCRQGPAGSRQQQAWRLMVGTQEIGFYDGLYGEQQQNLEREVGDFVLYRSDGVFAYQLATVVDDLDSGVDQVVRGADLLGSTARQIYLCQCLNRNAPDFLHLPLVLGDEGKKISKRHGDCGIVTRDNADMMMSLALDFLGQQVPSELSGAPAEQILDWALDNFDPALLQSWNRRLSDLKVSR